MNHEDQHHGVKLERRARQPHAAGHRVVDPPLRHPPPHHGVQPQRRRDRRALKVGRLARRVLGDRRRRHVEARQAREPAEHEEGQAQVVEGGADADGEGDNGGGDAEGDLEGEGEGGLVCVWRKGGLGVDGDVRGRRGNRVLGP